MLLLSKPNRAIVTSFLESQQNQNFSYPEVGASRCGTPGGYAIDHNRALLGQGPETFDCAKRAIVQWKMFDMPWVELCWPDAPIERGASVAILVSHLGFWSLNAARIVYVLEEDDPIQKYGFAYGTLPAHNEIGEERFSVEFHRDDESVWYDLFAFSRPRGLSRLAYPFTRYLQRRFAGHSKRAMQRAVG